MREDTQQGTVAKTVNNVLSPRAEGQDTGAVTLRRPPSSSALNPLFEAVLAEQRMNDVARNDRKQHDEKVTAQQCIKDRYTEHNGQED